MPSVSFKKNKDLNWYKTNVSLVDFILFSDSSFYIDKKSTNKNPRLYVPKKDIHGNIVFKKSGRPEKETILVLSVSKKDNHFLYWDLTNEGFDKTKTIIDFIQDFLIMSKSFDYLKTIAFLDNYLNSSQAIAPQDSVFNIEPFQPKEDKVLEVELDDYVDQSYLTDRGFNPLVINNNIFYPTIKTYHSEYKHEVVDKETGEIKVKMIPNTYTAFLLRNEKGIVGLNLKKHQKDGDTFKMIEGNKSNSLYVSALYPTNVKVVDQLIITESPEDCIAHYQLNQSNLDNKHIRYAAICGQVTEEQCQLISTLFDKYQTKELVLGNDNDLAGAFFNAKILSLFQPQAIPMNAYTIHCSRSKKGASISLIVDLKENKTPLGDIMKSIDHFNPLGKKRVLNIKVNHQSKSLIEIIITFQDSQDNWDIISSLLLKLKFNDTKHINITKSMTSDFTEDLN